MRFIIMQLFLILQLDFIAFSQPCQQSQPKDKLRSNIIEGFVFQAEQAGFISRDKGFISLYQGKDTLGREVWSMSPVQVATYREDHWLPRKHYKVKGYIVLVWEEAYKDLPIIAAQRKQLYQCLMNLIGGRVLPELAPRKEWRLETVRDSTGHLIYNKYGYPVRKAFLIIKRDITNGSPGTYNYIFGKDGTVKRYVPIG
jgi:hypothetical protein